MQFVSTAVIFQTNICVIKEIIRGSGSLVDLTLYKGVLTDR